MLAVTVAASVIAASPCATAASVGHGESAPPWPKISRLRDGSTVSVWRNGRVVVRGRSGKLLSESFCGSYARYERWATFLTGFRKAVLTHDHAHVAASVAWPLAWNHGYPWRTTLVRSRRELLGLYNAIFLPTVVRDIRLANPRALFCKNITQAALGRGVAWGDEWHGRPAIFSINGQ